MEELKKIFDVMHVIVDERFKLVAYKLKNMAGPFFDQWKKAEMKMHRFWFGLALKKIYWGISFLDNWKILRYKSSLQ